MYQMPKMRYRWFANAPRNVSEREYGWYSLQLLAALLCGLGALIMLVGSLLGLMNRQSDELASLPRMSVAEAANYGGDAADPFKLEGRLTSDTSTAMPDDEQSLVIAGELRVTAGTRDRRARGAEQTLFEWQHTSETIYLADDEQRIPLDVTQEDLPWTETPHFARPKLIYEGEYARTSRPVAVEYAGMQWPLPPEWGEVDSAFADLERRLVPQNQPVVVVARIISTPEGRRLGAPAARAMRILPGSEEEIRRTARRTRGLFAFLWIPLLLTSVLFARRALALRREFVIRSNQV